MVCERRIVNTPLKEKKLSPYSTLLQTVQ